MAERYYLAPIIGTGTENNPFRAAPTESKAKRVSATINSNPDGKPTYPWTICRVEAVDFTDVEAIEGVTRLGVKEQIDSPIGIGQQPGIKDRLNAIGEDLEAKDSTPRILLTRLIKKHYPHVKDVFEAFP